ncbi:MAG: hypothetical protein AB7R89_01220 [Dehalococcoidia bacterium]
MPARCRTGTPLPFPLPLRCWVAPGRLVWCFTLPRAVQGGPGLSREFALVVSIAPPRLRWMTAYRRHDGSPRQPYRPTAA